MIKAEELMIGNYVICEQCIHVVTEIRKNRVRSKWIIHPAEERDYECGFDELKLIPITEKILENFGFKKDKLQTCYTYYKHDFEIVLPFLFMFKTSVIYDIRSVHQLQNLYFALTGSKLSYTKNLNS